MAKKPKSTDMFDVVIAGGGYVGLSLAVALKQGDPSLNCAVVDPNPMDQLHMDPRASAIAAAASRMSLFISWTAARRPVKTARLTIEWPM